jgi:hypothetical protein
LIAGGECFFLLLWLQLGQHERVAYTDFILYKSFCHGGRKLG